MSDAEDEILIQGLEMWCQVGVPDEELAVAQKLLVDVTMVASKPFQMLGDEIAATIDYAAVCLRLAEIAKAKPRRLIETLASDMVEVLLDEFRAQAATVQIRKFILEQTEYVGVRCHRKRETAAP
ncbi:MAG: dihydroneopterin aldolase [Terrimicrobiaceae bacterium]